MKEYNIKLLVNKDEAEFLFECDKDKNTKCNKKNCNEYCNHTTDSRYMKAKGRIINTSNNKQISDAEIIIELEKEIEYYRNKLNTISKNNIILNKPDDIEETDTTDIYAGDKLIQTIIDYKY